MRKHIGFQVGLLISPRRILYLWIWNIYPKVKDKHNTQVKSWFSSKPVPNFLKGYYIHSQCKWCKFSSHLCLTGFDSLYWDYPSFLVDNTPYCVSSKASARETPANWSECICSDKKRKCNFIMLPQSPNFWISREQPPCSALQICPWYFLTS